MNKIYEILEKNGHEVYLVGGAVRDMLMGQPPKDMDFTTSALPGEVIEIFEKEGYEVILTGIGYGTVTVMIEGIGYEITTYRADVGYSDGRRPDIVNFSKSVEEDLMRRDLTINAMAYHPMKGIIDPFLGKSDMANGIIRAVGNPKERLREDFLRAFRAVRFSTRFGFKMDAELKNSIESQLEMVKNVSSERIFQETTKILMGNLTEEMFVLLAKLLHGVLPELEQSLMTEQNHPYHIDTVGGHTRRVINATPKVPELRWAALLHDMGKVETKTHIEGVDHFYGHAEVSFKIAERVLRQIRCGNTFLEKVLFLVKVHDIMPELNARAIRRFASKYKIYSLESLDEVIAIKKADTLGQNPIVHKEKMEHLETLRKIFMEMDFPTLTIQSLDINGTDLMNAGIKEGPEVGRALKFLLDKVLDSPELNNKSILLDLIHKQLNA